MRLVRCGSAIAHPGDVNAAARHSDAVRLAAESPAELRLPLSTMPDEIGHCLEPVHCYRPIVHVSA